MKIFRDTDQLPKIRNCVVTTGSFDGVHTGHQALIRRLNELARSIDGESVLITFYPHVRKVLYPDTVGKDLNMINSQKEKIELLAKTGLDNLVVINFTKEFAKTTAEEFVRNILVGKLGAKIIVVGYNHYFGHNKQGNYDKLIEMGQELKFDVVEIPKQDLEKETVGSTKIRKSLKDGKIRHANAYLEHIYFIDAAFAEGSKIYRDAGFRTHRIEIDEDSKLIPPDGIYAVRVEINNQNSKGLLLNNFYGSANHPGLQKKAEILLMDKNDDFSGEQGKVYVHKELSGKIHTAGPKVTEKQIKKGLNEIDDLVY